MPIKVRRDIGAGRNHGQALRLRKAQRRPHEFLRESAPPQLRRDKGVRQDDSAIREFVIHDGPPPFGFDFKPPLGGIVPHFTVNHRRLHAGKIRGANRMASRLLDPAPPSLGQHTAHNQLQRMVDHDRQENQSESGVRPENQLRHRHTRREGLL